MPAKKPQDVTNRDVGSRWTPALAKAGWTPISDFFLANYHRLKITHSEAMVLIHILSFKWDAGAPFPALKTIAKRMGLTPVSVRSHLRNLEKKGLIEREMQVGTTNRFHLRRLFESLEKLQREDRVAEIARLKAIGDAIRAIE